MLTLDNVPLSAYSTMRLGGTAKYLSDITNRFEIEQAVSWAEENRFPVIMIGRGSNIVWRDEGFDGLVLVNKIQRFENQKFDENTSYFTIGGGENWDQVVAKTVELGFSGLEHLSLIPGTVGAAPVQNIGAYGAQISDVLVTVEAYDIHERKFVILKASDCEFGYRTSRFKTTDRNRFLITAITIELKKQPQEKALYHTLESYLQQHNIAERTPQVIRDAVVAIRSNKLPNPEEVANCGSFFQNPIVSKEHLNQIIEQHPDLGGWATTMSWDQPDGSVKLAAGALIEYLGFKDVHDEETGMATWKHQSLVFVNEKAKKTADLIKFRDKIAASVKETFNITLVQEPELLP